jgi:uncharacterized protein (DUF58 family)
MRAAATAALGVALCLAGATFDSPSLYVPGVALVALTVGATVWVRLAARGATVVRAAGPSHVMEEEPYPLRLQVRSGLLPPPGGELLEPLLGWPVPLAGRWSQRVRINVRFSRRGRRHLDPPVLVIRDPLRLDAVERDGGDHEELLVLPRIEPVEPVRAGGAGAGIRQAGVGEHGVAGRRLDASSAQLDIDGLRPYREGAPASRIHWPTVARTGDMLERRLVADLDSAPLVVLDASSPASEDALDAAVRAAGSLCVHLARAGGCAILLPGERRPTEVGTGLGGWPQVHARLALVEAEDGVSAGARAPRGGTVFWVCAAGPRHLPRPLRRLTAAARYRVGPAPLPGYRAVFTVAGCTGQLLDGARRAGRVAA